MCPETARSISLVHLQSLPELPSYPDTRYHFIGRDYESSIWIRSVSINVSACKALHKRLPESWSLHDRLQYSPGWATRSSKATFQEPFSIERPIYIKINCPGWLQAYLVSSLLLLLIIRVSRLYPVVRGIALEPTMEVTISDGLTGEG